MPAFDDFDGLALFVRIVEAGGMNAAERAIGVSKATLSRRLGALERRLAVRLVRRTTKGVVLTDQGRLLFERGQNALRLAEDALAEVQTDAIALSGAVRLSLPPDMAIAVLAPALIRFRSQHPLVQIEMILADRAVAVIEEGFDLAIRMGPVADSDLLFRRIATLRRVLVASPDLLTAAPDVTTLEQVEQMPALAIRRDLGPWRLRGPDGASATIAPKIAFAANLQTILIEAAKAGCGVANLPRFMVDDAVQSGALVCVAPDWEPDPVEMTALWPRSRIGARLVEAIVTALTDALRERALAWSRCAAQPQDHHMTNTL